MADTPARYVVETLRMTAGMLIWAGHFTLLYTMVGVACARDWAGPGLTAAIAAATLAALAGNAWVLLAAVRGLRHSRDTRQFITLTTALLAAAGLIAVAWDGLPFLFVPAC